MDLQDHSVKVNNHQPITPQVPTQGLEQDFQDEPFPLPTNTPPGVFPRVPSPSFRGTPGAPCIDINNTTVVADGGRAPSTDLACVGGYWFVEDQDVNGDGAPDPFYIRYFPERDVIFVGD